MTKATAPVPPGWNDWHVSNNTGYQEFNYYLNDNGVFNFYPYGTGTYGVDVLNGDAQTFIKKNAHHSPFFVEAATFAPHTPYTPAPRNADDFPGMIEPRNPSFGAQNVNPPNWLGQRPPLSAAQVQGIDAAYRKRAQSVESVDKLLADTEATLAREGIAKEHVHRLQLRQRLPPGAAPDTRGQRDGLRHRHQGPAHRGRAWGAPRQGGAPGDAERRPGPDLRATRRCPAEPVDRGPQPRPPPPPVEVDTPMANGRAARAPR